MSYVYVGILSELTVPSANFFVVHHVRRPQSKWPVFIDYIDKKIDAVCGQQKNLINILIQLYWQLNWSSMEAALPLQAILKPLVPNPHSTPFTHGATCCWFGCNVVSIPLLLPSISSILPLHLPPLLPSLRAWQLGVIIIIITRPQVIIIINVTAGCLYADSIQTAVCMLSYFCIEAKTI